MSISVYLTVSDYVSISVYLTVFEYISHSVYLNVYVAVYLTVFWDACLVHRYLVILSIES